MKNPVSLLTIKYAKKFHLHIKSNAEDSQYMSKQISLVKSNKMLIIAEPKGLPVEILFAYAC